MIAQLLLVAALAAPAAPPDSMLITAAQLKSRIADPHLVLIQIGPREDYDTAHIAGARYVPFSQLAARGGPRALELPEPAVLDSALETMGISDDSRIVLYWTDEWISPTTRVFLTLTWFGLGDRTAILDGGLPAWRGAGGAVTKDVTPAAAGGHLTPHPRSDIVVDAAFVRAQVDAHQWNIVDARDTVFYKGTRSGTSRELPARYGHIPGARSMPFTETVDSGAVVRPEQWRGMLRTAGVDLAKPIIVYCHVGQQATAVWFASRLAGLTVRLYDGSFEDWATHDDFPLERP
jgi:thiosulfate/3-mercaptopyruvate sulfurtransferase